MLREDGVLMADGVLMEDGVLMVGCVLMEDGVLMAGGMLMMGPCWQALCLLETCRVHSAVWEVAIVR